MNEHQVELDHAGWSNWPRYTCYTCEGATLLRQPHMSDEDWRARMLWFYEKHPHPGLRKRLHRPLIFSPFPGAVNVLSCIGRTDLTLPDGTPVTVRGHNGGLKGAVFIVRVGEEDHPCFDNIAASAFLNNREVGTL